VTLEPADVVVQMQAPEGWAGVVDKNTQVSIDCRLTEELKLAGMAREIVRHVQNLRKDAGLEMEDRIIVYVYTDSPTLRQAIEAHREYIAAETLTIVWATEPLDGKPATATVKVDGQPLVIHLRKV
jgi:isoleucyl-tRNA synthetase